MAGWPQKALDLMTESPNLAAPSTFPGRKFGFQAKRSPTRTSSWPERTKKNESITRQYVWLSAGHFI